MNESRDDEFITFVIVVLAAVTFGPALLARFLPCVRDQLVAWHVLATDQVLLPIAGGAGLDLGRLAIAVGLISLLLVLGGLRLRQTLRQRRARRP
jgi:hypothetical protein